MALLAKTPKALLERPLEWFVAEHDRHRQVCVMMEDMAAQPEPNRGGMALVADFMAREMPLHVADEEEDFFPLLRRRCQPDDRIDKILGMLSREHRQDVGRVDGIGGLLARCMSGGRSLDTAARHRLRRFALHERRHLGLENAVVLPIARLRLGAADLAELSAGLTARRARRVVQGRPG